ncbi:MAG: SH3 domain-containing protein [Nostocales cyanobacterium 94392]|nr:SH3 domain-containing protein [Nostocales cyanobacterium 94392]
MLKPLIMSTVISSIWAVPALAQSAAYVFAPPTNIRNAPNGEIICTITKKTSINVYQKQNQWYYTDLCGGGYIHQSQIRLQTTNSDENTSNQARVVGIKTGQLSLRDSPNGRSLVGLNNGNVVKIIDQQGNWAYVEVLNGPNAKVKGMRGWVNSYYLALF